MQKVDIKLILSNTILNNIVFSKVNGNNMYIQTSIILRVFKTRKEYFVVIPERYIYDYYIVSTEIRLCLGKLRMSHFVQARVRPSHLP